MKAGTLPLDTVSLPEGSQTYMLNMQSIGLRVNANPENTVFIFLWLRPKNT